MNITAVYTAKQTEKILKVINKKTKVIISIFAGRAGDTGKDPLPEFLKSIKLAGNLKTLIFCGPVLESPTITINKTNRLSHNYNTTLNNKKKRISENLSID